MWVVRLLADLKPNPTIQVTRTNEANAPPPVAPGDRAPRGQVEDALVTLLHSLQGRLDGAETFARLLFIDFFRAFNCVQPHNLAERLAGMGIDPICWLIGFLTDASQKVNGVLSNDLLSSAGSPQGCVLAPLLVSLFTHESCCEDERCCLTAT